MNLDSAIKLLEDEIMGLGKPKPGEVDWWLIQGKSLGLTLLRTFRTKGFIEGPAADRFRRALRGQVISPNPGPLPLEPDPEDTVPQPVPAERAP